MGVGSGAELSQSGERFMEPASNDQVVNYSSDHSRKHNIHRVIHGNSCYAHYDCNCYWLYVKKNPTPTHLPSFSAERFVAMLSLEWLFWFGLTVCLALIHNQ